MSVENQVVPASVTKLNRNHFGEDSQKVKTICFSPDSLLSTIEYDSFSYMKSLKLIDMRECKQFDTIPDQFCYECLSLEEVILPDDGIIRSIGSRAFKHCIRLTKINFPYTIEVINGHNSGGAFYNCSSLKYIRFSKSSRLRQIMLHSFTRTSLKRFYIGPNVEEIDGAPFIELKNFEIIFDPSNKYLVNVSNVLYTKDMRKLVYILPNFQGELIIPNGVVSYSNQAFRHTSITCLVFNDGITSISPWSFIDCFYLTEIVFSSTLQNIEGYTFRNCYSLSKITFNSCPTIVSGSFQDHQILCGYTFNQCTPSYSPSFGTSECKNIEPVPIPGPPKPFRCQTCFCHYNPSVFSLYSVYVIILL